MGSCLTHVPKEVTTTQPRPNINSANNNSSNEQKMTVNSATTPVPAILGDLLTSYNGIDSERKTNINNLLQMIPNTIQILLNSNYEHELYNIYLETRILVKLRYEQYKNMEHYFHSIDEIVIKIEKQIQNNISNSILLTQTTPKILIDTLKICELEDNNNNNIKTLYHSCQDWAIWRDNKTEPMNVDLYSKDSMKCKVKSEIESFIIKSVEILTFYKETEIKKCLLGIDDIMLDLNTIINNKINDIFPKHYDITNYFTETYYKFFKGLLCMKLDHNKIETQNMLFVIAWIDSFKINISTLHSNTINNEICNNYQEIITDIVNDSYELILNSYMNTMTNKLLLWVTKMIEHESVKPEYFTVNNYNPRIHSVQSLLTLFNEQLHIINQYIAQIKPETLTQIISNLLISVDKFADLLLNYIQKNICDKCIQFKDEYCFALVNSSYFVTIKLKTHLANLSSKHNFTTWKSNLEDLFDEIIFKFTNIAKICSIQIGEKIVKENININECFTMRGDASTACDGFIQPKIISNLKYYCNILQKSIEEKHFFNEIIKSIINNMTNEYIESIMILNKMNANQISDCMETDMELLDEYFNKFENDIQIFWDNKHKILNAVYASFTCENGFLEAFTDALKEYTFYDELVKFIKKKRRMQSLINTKNSLRLKIKNISFKRKGNDS